MSYYTKVMFSTFFILFSEFSDFDALSLRPEIEDQIFGRVTFDKISKDTKYLIFSFKGLRNQHENTALVKVEGCANKDDSKWYIGKRCAYVYRVSPNTNLIEFSCYHWVFILNSREAIY